MDVMHRYSVYLESTDIAIQVRYMSQVTYFLPRTCHIGNLQLRARRSVGIREAFADASQRVRGHLVKRLRIPHETSTDTLERFREHVSKRLQNHEEGSTDLKCRALTPSSSRLMRVRFAQGAMFA